MSDGVPAGWIRAKLDAMLEPGGLFDGPFGSSLKTSDYVDKGVRVIRLENLANLRFITDKQTYISEAKYQSLLKHTVRPEDILVGSFVDGAVRVCLLPNLPTKAIAKADCFTVRTRTDIADRRFVAFQLGTMNVRDAFVGDIHGATRPRITTKQLRECELALAPLPEQHRIVEKVEALLEQVRRAKERLDRVPLILKRFRQAVLAAACSGELTREWRAADKRTCGTRSLARTIASYASQSERSRTRSSQEPATSRGNGELPEGWMWCQLDEVSSRVTDGTHQPPPLETNGVPFLLIGNIAQGSVQWDQIGKWVSRETYERLTVRAKPSRGDVLYTAVGATYGQAIFVDWDFPFVFQRHIALIKPLYEVIDGRYLALWLNTAATYALATELARGAAQPTVTLGDIKTFPVPLCSIEEQRQAVASAHRLLAFADTIEHRLQAATTRANKLPQAILSKAFSGELVPTEAELARLEGRTYETAEELLKRVTALGSDAPVAGKGRGRRARKAE